MGIATQKDHLRRRIEIDKSAARLRNFFEGSVALMSVLARACGHDSLASFDIDDLSTIDRSMADLTGIRYAGVS